MNYENILLEIENDVGIIKLNRPKQLNALNEKIIDELGEALNTLDNNENIGCIIITGNEKAFAAGADISAMSKFQFSEVYKKNYISKNWNKILEIRKPIIAAVAGYALGGGCEIAMMCDFIIAAENAKFGQPEIKIGIIPGAGGTQRLPRAVSKSKAMDMCLTSRMMDSKEAERAGLVSRIVPLEELMKEAMQAAKVISKMSLPSVMMIKESINRAYESPLTEGVLFERRLFHSTFATNDQKEGMAAFLEKRNPDFKGN
tara:strand:- start:267 stop:1043 length:777 start_codon:yes stop_codon:yes gene_type:complete